MVEHGLPKPEARVRFPSPALFFLFCHCCSTQMAIFLVNERDVWVDL